jgi:hypothetical protein
MKISTGNRSARATTDKTRSMPAALMPAPTAQLELLQLLGEVAEMLVTSAAPGTWESWRAVWPMMMISELGAGSAAAPMVPTWCPGKRSPSSPAGVECSSALSAGEA